MEQVLRPLQKSPKKTGQIRNCQHSRLSNPCLGTERLEAALELGKVPAVDDGLSVHEGRRRNNQTIGLEIAQPRLVVLDCGIVRGVHPLAGQR
jgi:hypothetical protein